MNVTGPGRRPQPPSGPSPFTGIVRVRVGDTQQLDDLMGFLTERGCVVERVGERELEAASLSSLRVEYAHLDLALHVQIWTKANPGVVAELLP